MSHGNLAYVPNVLDGTIGGAFNALYGDAQSTAFQNQTGLALDLRFADTKTLDNRITFTRASSGTFVDSAGLIQTASTNVARFTHDPSTLESLGLLIEESRTNLLLRSEEFDNVAWTKSNATVSANGALSPDGNLSADKLVEDTATSKHQMSNSTAIAVVAGTTYTISVFAKAAERTRLYLEASSGFFGANLAQFDISNGSVVSSTGGSASITALGGGWYRCIQSIAATSSGSANVFIQIGNGASTTYAGDGASGIYLWGAQLEVGAFATSYIATTAASATRAADVAEIAGSNFSSWYRNTQGTFVVNAASSAASSRSITLSNGTINEQIAIGQDRVRIRTGNVDVASFFILNNLTVPYALAYQASNHACARSGVLETVSSGAVPNVDRLHIGANATGVSVLNGTVARIRFYRKRLPNSMLQILSA